MNSDSQPVLSHLGEIDDLLVDGTVKGMPPGMPPTRLGDISGLGWNLLRGNVSFPAAVIRERALLENSRWMRAFLEKTGTSLCPHGKTSMAPQLFDLQLRDGAWGLTAATVAHIAVYRRFGVQRILLANQLVGTQALRYIGGELRDDPELDFYCLVDSAEHLELLLESLRLEEIGRPLQLLLEIGMPGGRTGAREHQAALELARTVKENEPWVTLRGVEGFEGLVDLTSQEGRARADCMFDRIERVAVECAGEGLFGSGEVLLTAGGSAYFDEVARRFSALDLDREKRVVLRSGCYLTHDVGFYGPAHDLMIQRDHATVPGGLTPALEVWSVVQSRPESELALVAFGKRDVSFDVALPVARWLCRREGDGEVEDATQIGKVVDLNDQHAYLRLEPEVRLEVGDLLGFGISHPCTTFDKWQVLLLVDDRYDVTGAVKTYF